MAGTRSRTLVAESQKVIWEVLLPPRAFEEISDRLDRVNVETYLVVSDSLVESKVKSKNKDKDRLLPRFRISYILVRVVYR